MAGAVLTSGDHTSKKDTPVACRKAFPLRSYPAPGGAAPFRFWMGVLGGCKVF